MRHSVYVLPLIRYCSGMLYLSRKVGESIVVNNNITMTVMEVKGKTAKIGFVFPPEASILRKEVHDRISQENSAALSADAADIFAGDMHFDDFGVGEPDDGAASE